MSKLDSGEGRNHLVSGTTRTEPKPPLQGAILKERGAPIISVILPAHNEGAKIERTMERVLHTLSGTTDAYELIVVDDGSVDDTFQRASSYSLKNNNIRAIRNSHNVGKGYAVKRGAKYARGQAVVVLDADMEIDPEQLKGYLHLLKDYDICIASKRHPRSVYNAPVVRKLLSVSFNRLVWLLTGVKCSDSQTGLKAIRGEPFRTIMDAILVKRYAYDVELLAVAKEMGLRVFELPVNIQQSARFRTRAVFYMLIDLLGVAYRLRILKWYQKRLRQQDEAYRPLIRI